MGGAKNKPWHGLGWQRGERLLGGFYWNHRKERWNWAHLGLPCPGLLWSSPCFLFPLWGKALPRRKEVGRKHGGETVGFLPCCRRLAAAMSWHRAISYKNKLVCPRAAGKYESLPCSQRREKIWRGEKIIPRALQEIPMVEMLWGAWEMLAPLCLRALFHGATKKPTWDHLNEEKDNLGFTPPGGCTSCSFYKKSPTEGFWS